ncbi:Succinylornithine transaminase/acetylornithine aminotransferase [Methyloligella halotolerans]|uniref:Acetylornithine aminotransferase n=1 Tax=Methyloligella halotolerans TaxID=1177755 RepID=A0A1E2RXS3_9HYPH|nr:aspartate aminotransferase family protein [Methyloligella halotolerans]ODA67046.1 Succinylornithine transaminase/acetylornithine aminotransferase [Methyloligella halotolerans]
MSALFPTYARSALSFERGEGAWLFDENGERYLDFGSGVAVTALGHSHPHLVEALKAQADKVWHVSNLHRIPGQERLAERLCEASFADRVFFANSGAEANEAAIKLARRYHYANGHPERTRLIAFEGAFHGRTLATIAAGGQAKHLEGFGEPMPGFDHLPAGDIEAVKAAVTEETAGIIVEPVMGEGGVRLIDPGFLRDLRALCDDKGILLIFDEVQTGMGRTGRLFAHKWSGVSPDIMSLAKGLGGGFPLGACLATEEVGSTMTPGTHGSTFGGNPLAMAVGNAVLDVLLEDGFLERVSETALRFKQRLAAIKDEHSDIFEEVRGQGFLLGLKCTSSISNGDLVKALAAQHLLTVQAGDNVVRLLPPLIIGEAEIDAACEKIEAACETVAPAAAAASA